MDQILIFSCFWEVLNPKNNLNVQIFDKPITFREIDILSAENFQNSQKR